jgi:lipid A 3-O-deacylase
MPLRLLAAALLAAGIAPAQAVDLGPDGASIEIGAGRHAVQMVGVDLVWDWNFERLRRAELTAHTELMLNRWRAHALEGGHFELTQAVLLPSLRMRLDRGSSPWFLEVGVGASWMDHTFMTPPDRRFGSRWNFYDVVGAGYTFGGAAGRNEIGLRWSHVSNAGLKKPNPGQDFLQLRYVRRF